MNSQENILHEFEIKEGRLLQRKVLVLLLILSLVISIADIIIITVQSSRYNYVAISVKRKLAVYISIIHFVLVPIAGLLLSLLFSLIPFKQKNFSQKYPSIAIILITLIQAILLTLTLLEQ